jgi:AAA-like domain
VAAVAAIALDTLDLTALEPGAQSTCLETMARLLCSVDVPLQLLVRRRRFPAPGPPRSAPPSPIAADLDAAVRSHRAAALAAVPAFRSDVVVVLRSPDGDAAVLQRQAGLALEALRAAGLRPRTLAAASAPSPTGAHERVRSVAVADAFWCGLELERLPGRPVTLGWLHPMLGAAAEFDASVHLVPVEAAAAHRAIERRLRSLTADRLIDIDRGRIGDAAIDVGLEAAGALRERLARNEVRPVRLSIAVAARGANEAEARHAAEVIRSGAAGSGLRLRHAHLRHAAIWQSTLPLGEEAPGGKLVDSAAAATCLPLTETVCDDRAGYRLGVARRSGVPVAVDVFDTDQHSNANLAVFATSGHGKSFTIGAVVLEAVTRGVGALIVDPEGEYEHLMRATGGQYLRLGSVGAGALNVFDAAPTTAEAIPVAVDLVHVLCGSMLDEVERARVDAALHDAVAAAAGRRPVLLGDCVAALDGTAPRAAAVLRRVCGGSLGAVFNRPSDINLDSDLCAISLRDLPHEFVPAATLLIAQWLWTRVRRERKRRHIVLDEVGALCVHPPLRELLVQLARRCRKYGASLVVATQNVEDLLRSEEGSVVATNCATVLLGGHRAAEALQMERAFGLTEAQRRFVEHAPRGEFLLLAGRRRCEIRIDVPDLHRSILVPP